VLTLKCAPSYPQAFCSMTPVDFVSQIITALALCPAKSNQPLAYHPICSHPSLSLADVVAALELANSRASRTSAEIKTISFGEWKTKLREAAEHISSLRLLVPFFDSGGGLSSMKEETVFS